MLDGHTLGATLAHDPPGEMAALLDILPDALICVDASWHLTYANAAATSALGLEQAQFAAKTLWEMVPDIAEEDAARYRTAMDSSEPARFEQLFANTQSCFDVRLIPNRDCLAIYFRDVTEERLAKRREDAAARRLNQAMETTSDAIFSLSREWRFTYLNGNARKLIDPENRVLGTSIWEKFPAARTSNFWENYHRTMDEGLPSEFEAYYPEPLDRWFTVRSQPTPDGIVVFFSDITEHKKQVQALAASEERYRVLADLNPQAIWMGDPAGNITYANQGFMAYIGLGPEQMPGTGWLEAFHPEDRARVLEVWSHCVLTGADFDIGARLFRAPTGEYRHWRLRAAPVRDSSGEILHWLGVGSDIHDELTATAALKAEKAETEKRNAEIEAIYQNTSVGLALFALPDIRFVNLNEGAAEMLGLSRAEVLGKKIEDIAPLPELLNLLHRVAQGESVVNHLLEGELPTTPGVRRAWRVSYLPVRGADGSVRAIHNTAIEVTQQRHAEAALLQNEKLAAVGRLASSISHEINNPLEAITNLLYLILHNPGLPDDLRVYVNMANAEISRVSQIATQSLRFHRQTVARTWVTAAELVEVVVRLYAGRLTNSGIKLDLRYITERKVLCFENDIRQVLNNLIGNAIDAMRGGGWLSVRAHDARIGRGGGIPGVRITVADTGHGMSREVARRIFEPFFTTKDLNGTGLGLWISSGIVERHKGRLKVRSSTAAKGHGTVFTLFLPIESEPSRSEIAAAELAR